MAILLKGLGIEYTPQAVIGDMVCDFLVPDVKIVIEVDGDYWHANPDKFPNPPAHRIEQRERDKRRDWFLRRHGFSVVRIWASQIESHPEDVGHIISTKIRTRRAALAQHTTTDAPQL